MRAGGGEGVQVHDGRVAHLLHLEQRTGGAGGEVGAEGGAACDAAEEGR